MGISEYAHATSRLRDALAIRNPLAFVALTFARAAVTMAAVLAVTDLTPLAYRPGQPAIRIAFVGLWALHFAVVMLWWARRRQRSAQAAI